MAHDSTIASVLARVQESPRIEYPATGSFIAMEEDHSGRVRLFAKLGDVPGTYVPLRGGQMSLDFEEYCKLFCHE